MSIEVAIVCSDGMCVIPVPFESEAVFGKVRARVQVTINGFTFRSTVARMSGQTFIPLRKSNRDAAAVECGDRVTVVIVADEAARVVAVPDDLAAALEAKAGLWTQWGKLSYTSQRECAESVLSAKKPETRERRIAKVIARVTAA